MWLDMRRLERSLARTLDVELHLAAASVPLAEAELTPSERARLGVLVGSARRTDWCLGRAALKQLLGRLGEDADTGGLDFPHRWLSLTHAAAWAVAAAIGSAAAVTGVGVDLESGRIPPDGSERFFLTRAEQAWLSRLPAGERARERLRLWTVKEALYKADLKNAGALVGDYCLDDCGTGSGRARRDGRPGVTFRYASASVEAGFLSVALGGTPC